MANEATLKRTARRLGWRLTFVGIGMVALHFTLVLPMMNGYGLNPLSLILALGATASFVHIWNLRGNAVEELASFRTDGNSQSLGAARLNNPLANRNAVWPLAVLLTAPVTILLLIAIIGPP